MRATHTQQPRLTGVFSEDGAEAEHQPHRKDLFLKRVRGWSFRSSNGDGKTNIILFSISGKRRFDLTYLLNSLLSQKLAAGI